MCYASPDMASPRVEQSGSDVLLWIKAVPGASRDQIAGALGDRLKILVSAPAEAGKANLAICRTLAGALSIKPRQVSIESGQASPEKIVRVRGMTALDVLHRLGFSDQLRSD